MESESRMKTFRVKYIHGVDDLKRTSPWFHSEYGWGAEFLPQFDDVTLESWQADPEKYARRAETYNKWYIQQLKDGGKYLEPYYVDVMYKENPVFDKVQNLTDEGALTSHRLVFIDFEK